MVGTSGLDRCALIASFERNHNGRFDVAERLVDVAASAGADGVKVARRSIAGSWHQELLRKPYRQFPELGSTYGEVFAALELPADAFAELRAYTRGKLQFIVAPHDLPSYEECTHLEPDAYAIDPAVLTHLELVRRIGAAGHPVLVGAGMCTDVELARCLEALRTDEVTLLHHVAARDLPLESTALSAIRHLRQRYGLPVGYSAYDCTGGAGLVALALGAVVVEQALTLDRHMRGPDHATSADRDEWRRFATDVRAIEASLAPITARELLAVEFDAFVSSRGTLVAACELRAGTVLEAGMLAVKPPMCGVSPLAAPRVLGRALLYDVPAGTPITFGLLDT